MVHYGCIGGGVMQGRLSISFDIKNCVQYRLIKKFLMNF